MQLEREGKGKRERESKKEGIEEEKIKLCICICSMAFLVRCKLTVQQSCQILREWTHIADYSWCQCLWSHTDIMINMWSHIDIMMEP